MTNTFSALSITREHAASASSKKESKINAIFSKLANSFHSHKKRRSSFNAIIDYFRSPEEQDQQNHPFANDAWFEQHRYNQQKKTNNASTLHNEPVSSSSSSSTSSSLSPPPPPAAQRTTASILMKHDRLRNASLFNTNPTPHHRYTQSTQSAIPRRKKAGHIRHYSHVSCISASNITVNSEDLTAKEFADIAGIRILSEDDDYDFNENDNDTSLMKKKICTFCGDEENDTPSLVITSCRTNNSVCTKSDIMIDQDYDDEQDVQDYHSMSEQDPQIWDQDFWQRPGDNDDSSSKHEPIMSQVATTTPLAPAPAPQVSHSNCIEPPPILHELLKRHSQYNMTSNQDTFIKKGRFEIHLNSAASSNMIESIAAAPKIQRPDASPIVLEWKRKTKPANTLTHRVTA